MGNVCAVIPGVMSQTGMETAEILHGLVREVHPDLLIAVDALAARSIRRLVTTIQLTDNVYNPIVGKSVDVAQNWNNPQNKKATILTDKNGKISIPLTIDTTFKSTREKK
jgi:hypothetical protein